jgi:hypothetical protein
VSNRIGFIGIRLPQIETAWSCWYFRLPSARGRTVVSKFSIEGMDENSTATYDPPRHIRLHD